MEGKVSGYQPCRCGAEIRGLLDAFEIHRTVNCTARRCTDHEPSRKCASPVLSSVLVLSELDVAFYKQ
jgi:hypothetical protein